MSEPNPPRSLTAMAIEQSVRSLMASGQWRAYQGENLTQLANWFSQTTFKAHVRLCSSGTFAVELALRSLKLQPNDEVILSSYDFPGNFRAIEDAGGKVALCDPAPNRGWTLDPERLEQVVAPECKAIVVSHLHGQHAPMRSITEWAKRHRIFVVEDACQAHGGIVDGRPAGSWGDLGVFSLGGSKLISAGRGGVVVTNDPILAQRMTIYCERGNDAYALSEIQAAVAYPQCIHLAVDHKKRLNAAKSILQSVTYPRLRAFVDANASSPAFYKLGFVFKPKHEGLSRDRCLDFLRSHNIDVGVGFSGFANRSAKRYRTCHTLAESRFLAENTLLIHHTMLLDPLTGEDRSQLVVKAMELLSQELDR